VGDDACGTFDSHGRYSCRLKFAFSFLLSLSITFYPLFLLYLVVRLYDSCIDQSNACAIVGGSSEGI
jgi:hypothetical protein